MQSRISTGREKRHWVGQFLGSPQSIAPLLEMPPGWKTMKELPYGVFFIYYIYCSTLQILFDDLGVISRYAANSQKVSYCMMMTE